MTGRRRINSESATALAAEVRLEMGRRIRLRRLQLGLSVIRLAEELGVSRESVYGYEKGSRALYSYDLPLMAETLDVPISYFFGIFAPQEPSIRYAKGSKKAHPLDGAFRGVTDTEMELYKLVYDLPPEEQDLVLAFARMVQERGTAHGGPQSSPAPDKTGGENPSKDPEKVPEKG